MNCLSEQHEWKAALGHGVVYTFTVVRRALARGWEERVPYVVAVVELDEGLKVLSNLINVDPDAVRIGMPVAVTFQDREGEVPLPQFQPA